MNIEQIRKNAPLSATHYFGMRDATVLYVKFIDNQVYIFDDDGVWCKIYGEIFVKPLYG